MKETRFQIVSQDGWKSQNKFWTKMAAENRMEDFQKKFPEKVFSVERITEEV